MREYNVDIAYVLLAQALAKNQSSFKVFLLRK